METLLINAKTTEKRIAILKDQKLADIRVQQPDKENVTGNIYLGRVAKVMPGMQAAFIDIGLEKNAYLSKEDIPPKSELEHSDEKLPISSMLHEGERVLVQVKKEGDEWKGPKVSAKLEFTGYSLVFMPYGSYVAVSKKITDSKKIEELRAYGEEWVKGTEGLLFRTAASDHSQDELKKELERLKNAFYTLKNKQIEKVPARLSSADELTDRLFSERPLSSFNKVICDDLALHKKLKDFLPETHETELEFYGGKENLFSVFKVEEELEKLQKRIIWLKNGSYLVIDKTEALTVVDVNSGKFTGKSSLRDTVLKTNIEAAQEITRQIKLRDLSGIILIDFIDMKIKQDQEKILQIFKKEMKEDKVHTRIVGFTELNILQLTRKKTSANLHSILQEPCPVCRGTGRTPTAETVAYQLERELWEHQYMDEEALWIEATADVRDRLSGEQGEHLDRLEKALQFNILFSTMPASAPSYVIKQKGRLAELKERK